jgi:hypothetical protein
MERHRTGQLMARADENMVGIALANYAAPQEKGHSVAFHLAFNEHGSRYPGCRRGSRRRTWRFDLGRIAPMETEV